MGRHRCRLQERDGRPLEAPVLPLAGQGGTRARNEQTRAIFGFCWKGRCWQRTAESTFTIWRGGWGCQQRVPAWGRASKYFPGIVRLVKEGLAMPFAALWGFIEGPAAVSGSMGPITRWKRRWLTSTAY